MINRKKHVIKMAHQLFIEKGFQATSIQDILDYSGISKGTFYNYFSSKTELLIELFKTLFSEMEEKRNALLSEGDPSNIDIFINQLELQLKINEENKINALFEEVHFSNDNELKEFIKKRQITNLYWLYKRFIDLFGKDKKPYLLDCAIMFIGILQHLVKYYNLTYQPNYHRVVKYSVERIKLIIGEISTNGVQLIQPEMFQLFSIDGALHIPNYQQQIMRIIAEIKESVPVSNKVNELLDFIHDEISYSKKPRKYLIASAVSSLREEKEVNIHFVEKLTEVIEKI
ncbi:TetR/AcrR family transcriptional regulator [Bacillus kwashiorkori]|uniref:TetR/AcrR family transcriptional regulator n=1 Tax=Bacillus kwashiorkori TaxID=1522318 RepID=UPI0007856F51|nr:TetR/AcrR family transcriptional regulator [Bacillus kwashiorkori]